MGNLLFQDDPYSIPEISAMKPTFEALQLRRGDIRQFLELYNKIDLDRDGSIMLDELMNHLNEGNIQFKSRIFSIFDENSSKTIDFREFVLSMWNYCTLSRATLDLFAFDLYDSDGSGNLSPNEIVQMFQDLYGKSYNSHANAKTVLAELAKEKRTFNIERFRAFTKQHPSMLFPAFQLQHTLRLRVLGVRFWERASYRRIEVSKGRHIPVAKFVELNMNKELHDNFIQAVERDLNKLNTAAQVVLENTGTFHYRHQVAEAQENSARSSSHSTATHSIHNTSSHSSSGGASAAVHPIAIRVPSTDNGNGSSHSSPAHTSPPTDDAVDSPAKASPPKPRKFVVNDMQDQFKILHKAILQNGKTTFINAVEVPVEQAAVGHRATISVGELSHHRRSKRNATKDHEHILIPSKRPGFSAAVSPEQAGSPLSSGRIAAEISASRAEGTSSPQPKNRYGRRRTL